MLLAGCVPSPAAVSTSSLVSVPAVATLRVQLVGAANAARSRAGMSALATDAALARAAQDYVRELAARGELSHASTRVGYETPMDRIDSAGLRVSAAAENLAALSVRAAMPSAVIDMWLESAGHRRNLLNSAYRITGAGAAQGRDGIWYFVQLYAR